MQLSIDDLYKINSNLNKNECEYYLNAINTVLPEYYLNAINTVLPEFEINTPLRVCHFLAQIIHESGHLKYNEENLNYSAKALRSVFGKYFKTDKEAEEYARKPEKIANRVYANRMGNGDEDSGDGWLRRGRGLIQLTGTDNYKACSKALNIDLMKNPDLIVSNAEVCVKTACWFWSSKRLNEWADKDDIITITKRINGGLNGIESRKELLSRAKNVLYI